MSDLISFQEAVVHVQARLNIPDPSAALWDAIKHRRVKAGFPGDHDDDSDAAAWSDYHLNTRAANMPLADRNAMTVVDQESLIAWIDNLRGVGPKVAVSKPDEQQEASSAQQAAAARAVRELWGGAVPAGLTNTRRDEEIQAFARKHSLAVPSERTIRRFFVARLGRS